jgi:hypothetical protein
MKNTSAAATAAQLEQQRREIENGNSQVGPITPRWHDGHVPPCYRPNTDSNKVKQTK